MTRILAWCDSPTAATGFGRSAQHVLHAFHDAGHSIVQLAVNHEPGATKDVPWRVFAPANRQGDPYGLADLAQVLVTAGPFDVFWTTFDPEVPWKYTVPGVNPPCNALDLIAKLRDENPCMRMLGWFPVDGGPLSPFEMTVLGMGPYFDAPVTMSSHVYGLMETTLKLQGQEANPEQLRERLRVIPHGVDLDLYRIPTADEKAQAKRELGYEPDTQVILQMERNQQRKQNYLGQQVLAMLFKRKPALRGKVSLFQHMMPDEENQGCQLGFNLPDQAWRFGLRAGVDVKWPPGWVSEAELVSKVYAAADVFLSTSTGEGFQYPAWEALACGVPVVLPDDSARAAWLSSAPNAFLYKLLPQAFVMRGGYGRHMGMPDAGAAAGQVFKLLHKPELAKPAAGRAFVEKVARKEDVQKHWLEVLDYEVAELEKQRRTAMLAVPGDQAEQCITMMHNPGLGDLVLAAPALLARRESMDGALRLRIPRTHLDLARLLKVADQYETPNTPVEFAESTTDLHELYHPKHTGSWGDPNVHRTETIAAYLDVDLDDLRPFAVQLPDGLQQQVKAKFLEAFGVDPSDCIALSFESASPHRELPRAFLLDIANRIKAMGIVPVIVGSKPLGLRLHGIIDITGQTELMYLIALLEQVGAAVCTDSSIMHFAAAVGTPTVGCFPTFAPESRLKYYAGSTAGVKPAAAEIDGEAFPPGAFPKARPGLWAESITPSAIMEALHGLLGTEAAPLKVVRPDE